jgi:hypothetical protein
MIEVFAHGWILAVSEASSKPRVRSIAKSTSRDDRKAQETMPR